jgi:hypothetical protein
MKNKYLIIVFLLGLAGMLTIQSCTKDESPTPVIYKAAVPANPTPAEGDVVTLAGTSYELKWEGTTTTSWDVYFGPAGGDLDLVKTSLTGNTFTVTAEEGGAYEWYVETKDANGIVSNNISGPARDPWYFYINSPPTIPVQTAPLDEAVNVNVVGTLRWTATDAEDAMKYNVFIGTSESSMAAVATGLTASSFVPTTLLGFTKYYWRVEAVDAHGATTSSVVHSFTTGKDVAPFVGKYLCDEPAEEYSYDISFSKGLPNTIVTTNYWNSGWTATFTLNFTKNTYTMTSYVFGAGWIGVESGTIDYATGGMVGEYSLWLNGVLQETGIHTYTKY